MRQQQTQKNSGQHYHLNLDRITYAALGGCLRVHRNHGNDFSNSVIVRRAVRAYLEKLEALEASSVGMDQEVIETKRAAKGVQ
ncbi:hypothetical protein Gbem_1744 [Citrifermentans bemidjiense Bem]|uniref:Uncharacterized protein n=1 Tax=Citrifermentans bemidjiense (strain ATCC BAA-1014 / DSM 16622 / JCM 12645 / Bem) TaxID=404380 RepID=B5EA54_CITBB|nr:hypothetical protein [Citrifermentans bemidjiense]ACH38760.1 hypothetical protein Gbem_1744 [Citrifermentans bemidjiense Bem]